MPDNDETNRSNEPSEPSERSEANRASEGAAPASGVPDNRRGRRAAASSTRRKGERSRAHRPRPGGDSGLDAGEMFDDALSRAADGSARWVKRNINVLQWFIVAGIAGWIGWQIYSWRAGKNAVAVSGLINEAVAAELGRVGPPDEEGERDARGNLDARRVFATNDDRLKEAFATYQSVIDTHRGTTGASLARLGQAGVLYHQGKFADAERAYEEVATSDLAKKDPESRGRALEGIGLCFEGKGDQAGALKRYGELENAEIPGFRELALYNEARLLHAKGDDVGAKERLKKVVDKLGKEPPAEASGESGGYLYESAKSLLGVIAPNELPAPSSNEALQKALREFQKGLPPGVKQVPVPMPKAP